MKGKVHSLRLNRPAYMAILNGSTRMRVMHKDNPIRAGDFISLSLDIIRALSITARTDVVRQVKKVEPDPKSPLSVILTISRHNYPVCGGDNEPV